MTASTHAQVEAAVARLRAFAQRADAADALGAHVDALLTGSDITDALGASFAAWQADNLGVLVDAVAESPFGAEVVPVLVRSAATMLRSAADALERPLDDAGL